MDREGVDRNREGTGGKEEGETGWYIKLKKNVLKKEVGLEEVTSFLPSVSKDTAGGHTCRNWLYLVMDTGGMSHRL